MPQSPIVLAFDSSTEWLSVALDLGDVGVLARTEPGGARASQRLLPLVQELLAEAGISLQDIGLIGFGAGPGAFTGLRAACAAAQGLGFGLDIPVAPVHTLLAVAESAEGPAALAPTLLVANDARMGELYWALAQRDAQGNLALVAPQSASALSPPPPAPLSPQPERQLVPQLAPLKASLLAVQADGASGRLNEVLPAHAVAQVAGAEAAALAWVQALGERPPAGLQLVGHAWAEHGVALAAALPAAWQAHLAAAQTVAPAAVAVARLARLAHARGESVAAAQALPIYVRNKVALTTEEREQARKVGAA
jgi:tRNA threonylcarbamoyladenosine biosynthesis protein TsaB